MSAWTPREDLTIHVDTLGRLAIMAAGHRQPTSTLPPVRSALLVYLAVERDVSREETLALFWPEGGERQARHSLNQALHRLRAELGGGWLRPSGGRLQATSALHADVHDFTAAVKAGELDLALALYGGRFLQGARLVDSKPFEEWVDRWETRLAALFRDACRMAIEREAAAGDLEAALAVARRWATVEPFAEEAHHRLIELLAASGKAAEALEHFDWYQRFLAHEELEVPDEILTLAGKVRAEGVGPGPLVITISEGRPQEDGPPRPAIQTPPARRRLRRKTWPGLFVGVLLVATAAAVVHRITSSPVDPRGRSVMVAPLENFTGDSALDPLGRMAADWVGQSAARHGIRVVPTADILMDLPTAGLAPTGDERARAVATRFHADLLVTGHYTRVGGDLVIRTHVSDLRSGKLWGPVPEIRAPADSPGLALERIEQRVTGLLVSQLRPGFPLEPATVLRPPTLEAYAAFLLAAEPFINGDYRAAIGHLARAVELDSTFVRAALFAASAHWNAGDAAGADSIARLLAGRVVELAPYEAAHLRWLQASLAGDLGTALHAAMAAADLAPGGPITGVAAGLALDLGRPRLALDLVNRMAPGHAQLPGYWDGRTRILHTLGKHREERQVARTAAAATPWLLRSLFWELRALAGMGRFAEIRARVADAHALPKDPRYELGTFFSDLALEVAAHGDDELANELFSRAAAWYDEALEHDSSAEDARTARARVLFRMGDNTRALGEYRRLAELRPDSIQVLGMLAVLEARLGNTAAARTRAGELVDGPFILGEANIWRARVEAALGDHEAAASLIRLAFREGFRGRFALHCDPDLGPLLRQRRFRHLALDGA
jgi:DNA-binding SARP family transcriptional activator/tetratricopeptide (TPR) repeat protein